MPHESLEGIVAGLDVLVRARYPLIAINTPEEGRFHRIVRAVAQLKCHREKDKGLFLWSRITGLRQVLGPELKGKDEMLIPDTQDAAGVLEHIAQQKKGIFVLCDYSPYLTPYGQEEPQLVRRLRELAWEIKGRHINVIFVYIPALAVWKIEGVSPEDRSSIEATRTWGTRRVNAFELAEDVLNLRTTSVTDEVPEPGGGTKIVVNDNETIAAQAKQIEIKRKFASWAWTDEMRTATLVRIYNERFNSFRKRECDGSHLLLPGMNSKITLYPHQRHAIWRIMTNKATLLAHSVVSLYP